MTSIAAEVTLRGLFLRFVACAIFLLCVFYYGTTHFYRDPGSIFFDASRAYERKYSHFREAEVLHFMHDNPPTSKAGPDATVCIAISSVKRPHAAYLQTSVASILQGLSDRERADVYLSVTIAQTAPDEHPDWYSPWLRAATDDFATYNVSGSELDRLRRMETSGDYGRKGVYDYAYVLQRCLDTERPYIVVLEDDIMAANGWLVRTLLGLRTIAERTTTRDWVFLRLFTQDRSIGWANQDIGGNHEGYIMVVVALVVFAFAGLLRIIWPSSRRVLDGNTLVSLVVMLNPGLVLLFFQSGKISVVPSVTGIVDQPWGCCSQALVFPREVVPTIVRFLQAEESGQVDLLLNRLARETPLKRYALYPVQIQHMGIDSARETTKEDAQQVWSIGFEDLQPDELEEELDRMLHELYGP